MGQETNGKIKGIPHPNQLGRYGLYDMVTLVAKSIVVEAKYNGTVVQADEGKGKVRVAALSTADQPCLVFSLSPEGSDQFVPSRVQVNFPERPDQRRIIFESHGFFNGDSASMQIGVYGRINPLMIRYSGFKPEVEGNGVVSNDLTHGLYAMRCTQEVLSRIRGDDTVEDSQFALTTTG